MIRLRVCALALLGTLAAVTPAAAVGDAVAFKLDGHDNILVPIAVAGRNGSATFWFLLDTGSNRSSVSEDVVARVGAPIVARTTVVTGTGNILRPVVSIGSLTLGSKRADELPAIVQPAAALRDLHIDGILAQDFLARWTYTLDFRHKRLLWDVLSGEDDADASGPLKLHESEGRLLVDLPQGSDRIVQLVPDSAATSLVIFDRAGTSARARLALHPARTGMRRLTTMTGDTLVQTAIVDRLQVGTHLLRDQLAVIVNRHERDAPEGDGLLPLSWFQSVTFNGPDGYLVVRR